MASYGQVAAQVAKHKQEHPERYCPVKNCLWRSGGKLCPKHQHLKGHVKELENENPQEHA